MCKTLLPLKLLADADGWQFLGKNTCILYFLLPTFKKKFSRITEMVSVVSLPLSAVT